MNRLTIKNGIDDNYVHRNMCFYGVDGHIDDCDGCMEYCEGMEGECDGCAIQECFNRLAEYEDTGLTPEEFSIQTKELMEYRKIGTVNECQTATEKQKAKKVRFVNMHPVCKECDCELRAWYRFCPDCGQAIDRRKLNV